MAKKLMPVVAALILVALLLSAFPLQPAEASPDWWDTNWRYRMELTFNNTASSENLTNFPVLVHLTSTHSDFWSHINSSITTDNACDLRFVDADDSTELHFEAESIDYASKDALIWVKVPQIDAGSPADFIYIYYGNPAATQSIYHSANDVWDGNFKMVQHLEETSGTNYDSTSNDNDGTPNGGVTLDATGKINGADGFDGTNDYTSLSTSSTLNFGLNSPLTVEGWYKTTEPYGPIVSFRSSTDGGPVIDVCVGYDGAVNNGGKLMALVRQDGGGGGYARKTGPTANDGSWHYFALARNAGNTIELFSDGISQGTASGTQSGGAITTNIRAFANERRWVQDSYGSVDQRWLNGTIDEVRISDTARSADWIEAQYLSMTDAFITYGSEEELLPLIAAFSADPTEGLVPLEVQFTDNSSGNITSWSWDFGDGGTSDNQSPSHTYTNPGTYDVTLTVSGLGGEDTEIKEGYITVYEEEVEEELVANFSGSPRSGLSPLSVQFTDLSTGNPTSWRWSFGDGETSKRQNPSHTYYTPGVYTVSLKVSGSPETDTETKPDYITVLAPRRPKEKTPLLVAPAMLSVHDLTVTPPGGPTLTALVTPAEVCPNQAVTINAEVVNKGDMWGSKQVELMINGQVEQRVRIDVPAHSSQPVSFAVYRAEPGTYSIYIEGVTAYFTVLYPPTRGGVPFGTGGIIALVVIGIALIAGIVWAIFFTRPA